MPEMRERRGRTAFLGLRQNAEEELNGCRGCPAVDGRNTLSASDAAPKSINPLSQKDLQLEFEGFDGRRVVAAFDGGAVTSDAGAVLLCQTDRAIGLIGRVAACFSDGRDPGQLIHALPTLVGQRIVAIALGYEDVNDHDKFFRSGAGVVRRQPRGRAQGLCAAGGQEHDEPAGTCPRRGGDRYHEIGCDREARQDVFVDVFLDAHGRGTMPPTIPCTATKGRFLPRLLRLLVLSAALRFLPAAVGGEAQALEDVDTAASRRWPPWHSSASASVSTEVELTSDAAKIALLSDRTVADRGQSLLQFGQALFVDTLTFPIRPSCRPRRARA